MTGQIDARLENQLSDSTDLINLLSQKVVGQSSATDGELTLCAERNFPILFKPFPAQDILNFIRSLPADIRSRSRIDQHGRVKDSN